MKLASWVIRKFKRKPHLGLICALVCVFFIDIATITGASQNTASWAVITCVPSALLIFLVFLSALERSRPRSAARPQGTSAHNHTSSA
jgi:peptidoglycan/LPS O-acetylase OafA/YrhL